MQITAASLFLIKTLSNFYLLLFLLRIVLQWVHADFYNPLSQFVLRATNPLVTPVRRVVPSTRAVDLPALIVLLVLEAAFTWLLISIAGISLPAASFGFVVVLRLIKLLLLLYIVGIFIYVILSWVAQSGYNPMARVLGDMVNPALNIVRRFLPPIAGLDLSPLVVLVLLQTAILLLPSLPGVLA